MKSNLQAPLLGQQASTVLSLNPSEKVLNRARYVNLGLTVLGMTSAGLLAMCLTNNSFQAEVWPQSFIIIADLASCLTTIIGKAAIVLYFNQDEFLAGFKKIWRRELPNYFNLKGRSIKEILAWALNLVVSINSSLFWTVVAAISFKQAGALLRQYDSLLAQRIGYVISHAYFYIFFSISTFYANIFAWPIIHVGAYYKLNSFLQCFLHNTYYHEVKADIVERMLSTRRQILLEIKSAIKNPEQENYPKIMALAQHLKLDVANISDPLSLISTLQVISKRDIHELRKAYIVINDKPCHPDGVFVVISKRIFAFMLTLLCVYGYRNILGISKPVYEDLNMKFAYHCGFGYFTYASIIGALFITVYPMFCNFFEMRKYGFPPHIISNAALAFIFFMVFFVSICGGLANAEQSAIDGESTIDTVNSDIASSCLDFFAIYMILRTMFERRILQLNQKSDSTQLKQLFITMRELGNCLPTFDEMKLRELVECAAENYEKFEPNDKPNYFNPAYYNKPVTLFCRAKAAGYAKHVDECAEEAEVSPAL